MSLKGWEKSAGVDILLNHNHPVIHRLSTPIFFMNNLANYACNLIKNM